MTNEMKIELKDELDDIKKMSSEDFFNELYGYTPEEYKEYTEEKFIEELNYIKTFFVDGKYFVEPKYNSPEANISKLFWTFVSNNATSNYEDLDAWYTELPKYNIRITTIYGQGSMSIIEEFDYTNSEYLRLNATRLKREQIWSEQERIKQLLFGKPQLFDNVLFCTQVKGIGILDTGIIMKVYTKNDVIRYLIDSVYNGIVLVYYDCGTYPMDMIEIIQHHPDNY